ncbi:unnamed protein product [Cladocopium goreaui]|uniref:UPF0483 protein n=1 Tax=Cladocopium goreaui TaxID=2562237 RepID=A0A9P1GMP5_9DINO|nr:unnamed protein product [Cladocopium goreaui]
MVYPCQSPCYPDPRRSLAADADVVVAFSQGGTMLAIYMDEMRKALRPVQWRLGVFFCGAMIDDEDFQLLDKLPLPALYIHGGDTDPWGRHGEKMLPKMYTELEMLEHSDGHSFPSAQPRAGEIYQRVICRMRHATKTLAGCQRNGSASA